MNATAGDRVLAPFGRRACAITAAEEVGAYRILKVADPGGPRPSPGQFYMLAAAVGWGAGEDERPYLPRALSFLEAGAGTLSFMLEAVGPGTERLVALAAGDELWLMGPLGRGFDVGGGGDAVLVGGGVGVPPLAALQRTLLPDARALVGFRDAAHAKAAALLENVSLATDDGSSGHHGLVTDLLGPVLDPGSVTVYACGPPAMLEAVRVMCARHGTPVQLALEAAMACGYGACFGCAVPLSGGGYGRVCVDGPVFDGASVAEVPAH